MVEQDYTISEEYVLPSKGLIYAKPIDPNVKLRSMTTREEMKRQSPTTTPYKVLSEIIEACCIVKPAISVYDMCLGDYEYLLHKLRVVTYGPEYKMAVGCPHCGEMQDTSINLDDLAVKEFDKVEVDNLMCITLPVSKKLITLNYQTPRMLDEIDLKVKEFKKRNKTVTIDPTPLIRLKTFIDLVEDKKLNDSELENFVMNLPAKDKLFIEDRVEKLSSAVGLDATCIVTCDKCGGEILTFFRFGPEFFRPSID